MKGISYIVLNGKLYNDDETSFNVENNNESEVKDFIFMSTEEFAMIQEYKMFN